MMIKVRVPTMMPAMADGSASICGATEASERKKQISSLFSGPISISLERASNFRPNQTFPRLHLHMEGGSQLHRHHLRH